jgi:hypothetical protein
MRISKSALTSGSITAVLTLIVFFVVAEIASPSAIQLPSGKGTIICGRGFFYNDKGLSPQDDNSLFYEMEETAKICDDQEPRDKTDVKKASVLIRGEVCVVNWELTPAAALEAYRNTCLAGTNEYM